MGRLFDVNVRRWLYGIGIAIGGVLLVYGLVSERELVAIMALLNAILGLTAFVNVGEAGVQPRHAVVDDADNNGYNE